MLNGNHAPPFGIANLKIRKKTRRNKNKGQISWRSCDRQAFWLNFTSTVIGHIIDIPKSLSEVPSGLLVSNTLTYCSVIFLFIVRRETEVPVHRYWYPLRSVSSSKTILEKDLLLYCFKKSLRGTFFVSRTTSMVFHWTLAVLYNWIAPVERRMKINTYRNHFFINKKISDKMFHIKYNKSGTNFNVYNQDKKIDWKYEKGLTFVDKYIS